MTSDSERKVAMTLDEYRKRGLHLPPEFRDFHDQKDVFKLIGGMKTLGTEEIRVNWVDGMCYTIDYFLWIMAAYGYELKRTTKKVTRRNLQESIEARKQAEAELFRQMLNQQEPRT